MKKLLIALLVVSSGLMAKDYALIVSISKYRDNSVPTLSVAKDIERYRNILTKFEFRGKPKEFHNSVATKYKILKYIKETASKIKKDDRFFMFFVGHGTDANDEDYGSKLQETLPEEYWKDTGMILPYDFNPNKNAIAKSVIIGRRDLRKYFNKIDKTTQKAFIVFDACFSQNSSKGTRKHNAYSFLHLDTINNTYPYKNIVYIGASKTQAKTGKLSAVLDSCISKNTTFVSLKGCMNKKLKKSPHRAIVLSKSDSPMIFAR